MGKKSWIFAFQNVHHHPSNIFYRKHFTEIGDYIWDKLLLTGEQICKSTEVLQQGI